MSNIVLSSAVRQNLLALQQTAAELATTQNDLSTGNKVNSALDNPTNYFTASGLNNRASDISNLLDGISNGVQVLQAANTGLTSLQSLVSQAQSIANQALQSSIGYSTKASVTFAANTGATSSNILGTTSGSYTGGAVALSSGTATGTTALSNLSTALGATDSLVVDGKTISFGTGSTSVSASGSTINDSTGTIQNVLDAINAATGTSTASVDSSGKIVLATDGAAPLSISGSSNALAALNLATGTSSSAAFGGTSIAASGTTFGAAPIQGDVLQIPVTDNGSASTATITFGTGAGQISTLADLNTALAANNLEATIDSTGALTITTTNDAASATIGSVVATQNGTAVSSGPLYNPSVISAPTADEASQSTRNTLVSQYNAILTQIDNTASDSSYNGVNLLNGDQLQLTFDETGKSKLDITGVQDSSAGLGLSQLQSGAFDDNNATNTILTNLNSVETTLRSQASAFGSNLSVVQTRQDFNTSLINVLQTGAANLTQADINLEAANSQALSTRQSLSISALSLANQSQQSVLQLLR